MRVLYTARALESKELIGLSQASPDLWGFGERQSRIARALPGLPLTNILLCKKGKFGDQYNVFTMILDCQYVYLSVYWLDISKPNMLILAAIQTIF